MLIPVSPNSFCTPLAKSPIVDASAFCKNFGGGGHVRAGGCGFDCTIDEAKDLLMAKALDVLK